jgi:hypothetical protein
VSEFIVAKVGPFWSVVNNGVIFGHHPSQTAAVAAAVGTATRAALADGPKRVILEEDDGRREVIWNSEEHTDTRHDGPQPR